MHEYALRFSPRRRFRGRTPLSLSTIRVPGLRNPRDSVPRTRHTKPADLPQRQETRCLRIPGICSSCFPFSFIPLYHQNPLLFLAHHGGRSFHRPLASSLPIAVLFCSITIRGQHCRILVPFLLFLTLVPSSGLPLQFLNLLPPPFSL